MSKRGNWFLQMDKNAEVMQEEEFLANYGEKYYWVYEDKQKEIERQAKLNDAIALYKAQQDDIDFRNADKKEKIAIETFNTALAEIGDEAFVNEAKKRGKLKTPQTYDAFKTLWLNFSGNPAIFQDADFRNDWMTNGGAVNINEDEVVNNLTSNDAALAGQKNTGDALIKTKSIPSGVSIQKTPERFFA